MKYLEIGSLAKLIALIIFSHAHEKDVKKKCLYVDVTLFRIKNLDQIIFNTSQTVLEYSLGNLVCNICNANMV